MRRTTGIGSTLLFAVALWMVACSDDEQAGQPGGDDDSAGGSDGDDDSVGDDDTSGSGCVDVWVTWLQEVDASHEVVADWSTLTEDAYGNPLDPVTDITQVMYTFLYLSAEEARQAVCDASLVQSDVAAYFADTCQPWPDMVYGIDTSGHAGHALTVSLFSYEEFRMIAIADVVEGASNTLLVLENGGAVY